MPYDIYIHICHSPQGLYIYLWWHRAVFFNLKNWTTIIYFAIITGEEGTVLFENSFPGAVARNSIDITMQRWGIEAIKT